MRSIADFIAGSACVRRLSRGIFFFSILVPAASARFTPLSTRALHSIPKLERNNVRPSRNPLQLRVLRGQLRQARRVLRPVLRREDGYLSS
eukprot:31280-Pelagococcus_subviridis.AAC.4